MLEPLLNVKQVAKLEGITRSSFLNAWRKWHENYGFPAPVRKGFWCPNAIAEYRHRRSNGMTQQPTQDPSCDLSHDLTARLHQLD